MQAALKVETTVLPGHRVEFSAPELPEGERVEVFVVLPTKEPPHRMSMIDFLRTLPPGPRAFETWGEYEKFLKEEKDSWE